MGFYGMSTLYNHISLSGWWGYFLKKNHLTLDLWWLMIVNDNYLVGGLVWNILLCFPYIGKFIIPIDELIFSEGVVYHQQGHVWYVYDSHVFSPHFSRETATEKRNLNPFAGRLVCFLNECMTDSADNEKSGNSGSNNHHHNNDDESYLVLCMRTYENHNHDS